MEIVSPCGVGGRGCARHQVVFAQQQQPKNDENSFHENLETTFFLRDKNMDYAHGGMQKRMRRYCYFIILEHIKGMGLIVSSYFPSLTSSHRAQPRTTTTTKPYSNNACSCIRIWQYAIANVEKTRFGNGVHTHTRARTPSPYFFFHL